MTRSKTAKSNEIKYYGVNTCLALWRHRAQDIIRVYVESSQVKVHGELLRWCAKARKAYHILDAAGLEKVAGAVHHEGLVILAQGRAHLDDAALLDYLKAQEQKSKHLLIYADGVHNPHNIGALLRSCAHFGALALVGEADQLPRLSPSAMRVAEGGVEHVHLCYLESATKTLGRLREAGYRLVGASAEAKVELFAAPLPARCILVLGHEVHGLSAKLRGLLDETRSIGGTFAVESLNVSVAGAVMMGEWWRQHRAGGPR